MTITREWKPYCAERTSGRGADPCTGQRPDRRICNLCGNYVGKGGCRRKIKNPEESRLFGKKQKEQTRQSISANFVETVRQTAEAGRKNAKKRKTCRTKVGRNHKKMKIPYCEKWKFMVKLPS